MLRSWETTSCLNSDRWLKAIPALAMSGNYYDYNLFTAITDRPWIMSKSTVVAPPTEAMVCSLALSWWRVELRARLRTGNWRSRSLRGEERSRTHVIICKYTVMELHVHITLALRKQKEKKGNLVYDPPYHRQTNV